MKDFIDSLHNLLSLQMQGYRRMPLYSFRFGSCFRFPGNAVGSVDDANGIVTRRSSYRSRRYRSGSRGGVVIEKRRLGAKRDHGDDEGRARICGGGFPVRCDQREGTDAWDSVQARKGK